ncbi:MAG TPA: TIM barrel protein [Clostridia bacterium]|nr:TIM barrel protein [Clostridia bacterium]
MVQIGCLARYFNKYEDEVAFAIRHGFDFMQVWYDRNGIALSKDTSPKEKVIKYHGFPTIIHAVLDINEFQEHVPKVMDLLGYLNQKEVIIHPICESEVITEMTIHKLANQVSFALNMLGDKGITLYLENNSKIDPIFNTPQEISIMFEKNPGLEFILDVAHMESYKHLKDIVTIKKPKVLHVADKHFDVIHEHLPVGQGEIDYGRVFNEILHEFSGKIVLEVIQSDEDIINSRDIIKGLLSTR